MIFASENHESISSRQQDSALRNAVLRRSPYYCVSEWAGLQDVRKQVVG